MRIKSVNIDNSHSSGQNFSWLQQVGHETEQQWATNLRNAVRRICVKIECRWLCKPIRSQSNCQLIHKNYTQLGKNLDWCWIRKTLALRWSSVEEIDPSSSSWKPTSRQWCSDWILENKRSSSESFLYYHHWSDEKWKSSMAGGGQQKKKFQYCSDSIGTVLFLRALQGRSGRNSIDPTLQDNVIIPDFSFLLLLLPCCSSTFRQTKVLWVRKLRSTIERENPLFAGTRVTSADPLYTNTHQATQNGTLLKIGLLKSGNLMDWWMIERWDPLFALEGGGHQFVIEEDETESELSLGSRSFLHRVNDQVRKKQKNNLQ